MSTENDVNVPFEKIRLSVLYKACSVTPSVKNITLGPNSPPNPEVLTEESSEPDIKKLNAKKTRKSKPKKAVLNKHDEEEEAVINRVELNLVKKALAALEERRLLSVQDVMRERMQNWQDQEELIHARLIQYLEYSNQEYLTNKVLLEQKILNDLQEQEIRNKYKREALQAEQNLINAQRVLERNQKVKLAEDEAKHKSQLILEKRKKLDKIFEYQKMYRKEYLSLLEMFKSCQDKSILNKITSTKVDELKACGFELDQIFKKCKLGDVTDECIERAEKLVCSVQGICKYFENEIKLAIDAVEEKNKQEKVKAEEQVKIPATVERTSHSSDLSDCFTQQSLQLYTQTALYLSEYEKLLVDLVNDDSAKKFRFDCQKAINIPVNAISPISSSHLLDKYNKLHKLLQGHVVDIGGDLHITASQHPQGVVYCMNVLAKKFVRQGDLTVSSKPDAAFSIASVLVNLWVDFPQFGQLVLGHFYALCPYLAPVFMPQVEGQSDESYYRSLGYQYSQSGEVEKQDKFLKRMSGITRLYSAILITRVRQTDKKNPLGMVEAWRWLSSILNLEPRPDICATILHDFLEVAGHQMFATYRQQFNKILVYICQEYFPKLEQVTPQSAGGPLVRLEQFLQKVLKQESIPPPEGVLPPNFW